MRRIADRHKVDELVAILQSYLRHVQWNWMPLGSVILSEQAVLSGRYKVCIS